MDFTMKWKDAPLEVGTLLPIERKVEKFNFSLDRE